MEAIWERPGGREFSVSLCLWRWRCSFPSAVRISQVRVLQCASRKGWIRLGEACFLCFLKCQVPCFGVVFPEPINIYTGVTVINNHYDLWFWFIIYRKQKKVKDRNMIQNCLTFFHSPKSCVCFVSLFISNDFSSNGNRKTNTFWV